MPLDVILGSWRQTLVLACIAITLGSVESRSAQTYSVTDLGPIRDEPQKTDGKPTALNGDGQVTAVSAVNNSYRAFLYGGAWTNLGTLGGAEAFASGIEGAGRVVGYSQNTGGTMHAFLWTPGGTN